MIINLTKAKLTGAEICMTMVPGAYLTDRPGAPIVRYAARVTWVPSVRLHFETPGGSHSKTYHPSIKD